MANLYTRDTVEITPMTYAVGTGSGTKGVPFQVGAMVENDTDLGKDQGRGDVAKNYAFLAKDVVIKKGDKIQIIKMWGKAVTEPVRVVQEAARYGGFSQSHWEVYF